MDIETTDTTAAPDTTDATSTTTQPATAPAKGKVTFSPEQQAEVDRLIGERLSRVKKETPKPTNGNGHISAEEVQRMLVRDRALTRAATTAALTDKQTERMEAAMRADNPEDPSAWSRAYLEDMGLNKTAATPPPTAGSTEPAKPPAAAPSAPSGPAQPGTIGGVLDLFNLSHEQMAAMGPEAVRAEFEKITNMGRRQQGALPPRVPATRK